jgi:hypothetical protein
MAGMSAWKDGDWGNPQLEDPPGEVRHASTDHGARPRQADLLGEVRRTRSAHLALLWLLDHQPESEGP